MKITYDDYVALYPDHLTQEVFSSLLPSGIAFINAITANRAQTAAGYKAERVTQAVCAVVNEMAAQNACRGSGGARVSSVSNDGYSETYGNLSSAEGEEKALRRAAMLYLSGTGLAGAL